MYSSSTYTEYITVSSRLNRRDEINWEGLNFQGRETQNMAAVYVCGNEQLLEYSSWVYGDLLIKSSFSPPNAFQSSELFHYSTFLDVFFSNMDK